MTCNLRSAFNKNRRTDNNVLVPVGQQFSTEHCMVLVREIALIRAVTSLSDAPQCHAPMSLSAAENIWVDAYAFVRCVMRTSLPMLLKEFTCQFLKHTAPCRRHLTPELVLRLVTPACPLWSARAEDSPFTDPFWGFYWPGGQATARYILDNTEIVKDRRVLDVGCGCGAGAIAAAVRGARRVVANDIDPYAVLATKINAKLNNAKVEIDTNNFIGKNCNDFDVILIGDMFYDEEFASILFEWLYKLTGANKLVLIGDPGRHGLSAGRRRQLTALARYELSADTRHQNNGFTHATVWRMTPL